MCLPLACRRTFDLTCLFGWLFMNNEIQAKLAELNSDYTQITGQPFQHFSCPILFVDEDTELCKAHIVNQAFPNSSSKWTVQRKDVDGFYGTFFESDFVDLINYKENGSPDKALVDKSLGRRYAPRILVDDVTVGYYPASGDIPEDFTPVLFERNGKTILLGLKMHPNDVDHLSEHEWALEVSRDVRLPALVSLIKSAHLTLFEILGYQYTRSSGGHFVGSDILGKFFIQSQGKRRAEVLEDARDYFGKYANMVRLIQESGYILRGTIDDGWLFVCNDKGLPWAFVVIIKTSGLLHAVLIPILDRGESADVFQNFLRNSTGYILDVNPCRFVNDHWETSRTSITWHWPPSKFS